LQVLLQKNQNNLEIKWSSFTSNTSPKIYLEGYFYDYVGATLTAKAFDTVGMGLGKWLITIASWFFAISTIMAWGYYGEQGIIYILGEKGINSFRLIYCLLIFVSTLGFIETSIDLDNLSGIGLGIIVYANLPICWIFGYQAIKAYKQYVTKNST
jgi:AGCS family alanine or glycine:cation symporter